MDFVLGALQDKKEGKRPREWADVPLVKGFVSRPVESNPQSLRDFYEDAKEIQAAYRSYRDRLKNNDLESAKEIWNKYPVMILSPYLDSVKQSISQINKNIEMVSKSLKLSDEQKRVEIRRLEEMRMKTAKLANKDIVKENEKIEEKKRSKK
jgi:hypothetical protein